MKKKESQRPAKQGKRAMIILAVAAIVVATAVTVISRQNSAARTAAKVAPAVSPVTTTAAANASRRYVTRRVGNQDIQIDTQTGRIRPLSPQEAQKLAEGLAPMVDQSTEGLVQVRHSDGSVSMDLQGRFQDVVVARVSSEGVVEQSCVNNPEAAGKFFGIDPKLIKDAQARQKRLVNPN